MLALIPLIMACYMLLPLWSKTAGPDAASLSAYELVHTRQGAEVSNQPVYYLAGLALLASVLALVSIFQYGHRGRQMLFNLINSLVMVALLGLTVYTSLVQGNGLFSPEVQGTYGLGFYLLAVALLSNVAANRFIRMDERRVRDAFERFR